MSNHSFILSLPIFWREERILQFWVELCECMKQSILKQNTNKNYLERLGNQAHIQRTKSRKTPFSWFEKFHKSNEPIKIYLQLITKHATPTAKYNGNKWFDLLRAIRDLNIHIYGTGITNLSAYATGELDVAPELRKTIRTVLKQEGVNFWLKYFPDLLLITYSVGYVLRSNSTHDIGTEFGERFFRNFESWTIPVSLDDFTRRLDVWFKAETSNNKTASWKYSFKTDDNTSITFLGIPSDAIFDLENREMLTIRCSASNGCLQVSRNTISAEKEATYLLVPDKGKELACKFHELSKNINLKAQDPTEFSFVACSDIISAALAVCFEQTKGLIGDKKTCVIFTKSSSAHIKNTVQQFCHTRRIKFDEHILKWTELSSLDQDKLKTNEYPWHKRSSEKVKLEQIINSCQNITSTIQGDVLLKLMHEGSSGILETHVDNALPQPSHTHALIERFLSDIVSVKETPFSEKDFLDHVLSRSKNVCFLSGIAGIGKSSFLSKLGYDLLNDDLVLLTSCKQIKRVANTLNEWSWLNNEFEHTFLTQYVLNVGNYKMSVLIDGFDLLTDQQQADFVNFFDHLFTNYGSLITNVFIVARANDTFQSIYNNNDLRNKNVVMHQFKILKLDPNAKVNYITSTCWKQYIIDPEKDKFKLRSIAEKIIDSTFPLGDFADTPLACRLISKMYGHVARASKNVNKVDLLTDAELCRKFQNVHLKNDFPKNLHKSSIPKQFQLNMATVDTSSPIFQMFKKSVISRYYQESLQLRFENWFDKSNIFYINSSEFSRVYGNVIDMKHWGKTLLPDYYCALFLSENEHLKYFKSDFKATNDFLKMLFNFNNDSFEYHVILKFLDNMVEKNNHSLSLFCEEISDQFFDILQNLLCCGFNHIFIAATAAINIMNMKPYANCNANKAVNIMRAAIKYDKIITVKFLVEIWGFDLKSNNENTKKLLHDVLRRSVINISLLQYLVKKGADISAKNLIQQSVFRAACNLKLEISTKENILSILVNHGDIQFLKDELEAVQRGVGRLTHDLYLTLLQKLSTRIN